MNTDNVYKSGFVTMIGRPNVGKSTLMNKLIGQKIAIMSNKPQTTRKRIKTVYTDDRGQIVFFDTPGIIKPKNKLGEYMKKESFEGLNDADVICYLVEPKAYIGEADKSIIEQLKSVNVPVILVINKCDTVEKADILPVIKMFSEKMEFKDIVPVCARNGNNVDDLLSVIFDELPEGPMYYDEDTVTDMPMRAIAAEIIREKSLHALSEEVPHGIAVVVDKMHDREGTDICDIDATIFCERDSHKGIIIGKRGAMLKKIGSTARYELERELGCRVNLKLWVKVDKDWRENGTSLKNFGYIKES